MKKPNMIPIVEYGASVKAFRTDERQKKIQALRDRRAAHMKIHQQKGAGMKPWDSVPPPSPPIQVKP